MNTPVRKIIEQKVGSNGLFVQPKETGPDRELVEGHNRLNFANNFNFADETTGNTRTFDPLGNYNCGRCNKADGTDCLLVTVKKGIDRTAGSCRHWENLCAGDPEQRLTSTNVEDEDTAVYGVAKNGVGFGCKRCPYASRAFEPDSRGRDLYCGKGDFRIDRNSCCQLNGAAVVGSKAVDGSASGRPRGIELSGGMVSAIRSEE